MRTVLDLVAFEETKHQSYGSQTIASNRNARMKPSSISMDRARMRLSSFPLAYSHLIVVRGYNLPALLLIKRGWNFSAFTSIVYLMIDRLSPLTSDWRGVRNPNWVILWAGLHHKCSYISSVGHDDIERWAEYITLWNCSNEVVWRVKWSGQMTRSGDDAITITSTLGRELWQAYKSIIVLVIGDKCPILMGNSRGKLVGLLIKNL